MSVSSFKYASQQDLTDFYPNISEYDTKKSILNWEAVTHDSVVYDVSYNSGNVANFYINGANQNSGKQTIGTTVATTTNHAGSVIAAGATSIDVLSGGALTDGTFIKIGDEILGITNISTNTITVTRGMFGTTAAVISHASYIYKHFQPNAVGDWLYDSDNDFIVAYASTRLVNSQTESGEVFSTIIDRTLVNASSELSSMLDAKYPRPLPKVMLDGGTTEEYDPIIKRATCAIAASYLIRATDPTSEAATAIFETVTNIDETGIADRINAGKLTLSFEVDKTDKSGDIHIYHQSGTMALVETWGTWHGELYDKIKVICSVGGAYGTAKVNVFISNATQIFGDQAKTDEIVTGNLQQLIDGIYVRFEGASMDVDDEWHIEVRNHIMEPTNTATKSIECVRNDMYGSYDVD